MKQNKKNSKGTTLVSVVVASLLLAIIFLSFQKSIQLTASMVQRAVDIRQAANELVGSYYLESSVNASDIGNVTVRFEGIDGLEINTKLKSSTAVISDPVLNAKYSDEFKKIYFFSETDED